METLFKTTPLERAIEAIVAAAGSEAGEARQVAENLVTANLLGHDSHGIGMIPRYIDAVLEGGLAPNQHPKITIDAGALIAVDGCKGYGQVIGREAMLMAIERAKRLGSCVMALGNSHHLGRVDAFRERNLARARGTAWRTRRALRHQSLLYRHTAARRGALRARLRDQRRGARQDARRP